MHKRGMTLVELLVALSLAGVIFLAIFHVSTLAGKQIGVYVERYNAYSQVGYALEDMALRMPSASIIRTPFQESGINEVHNNMSFRGSGDPYNVVPYEGDTEYWYGLENGDSGALLLKTNGEPEILVEARFEPKVEFIRHGKEQNIEPNFLTVVVTANCRKSEKIGLPKEVVKAEGIKFWFVDVVAPQN